DAEEARRRAEAVQPPVAPVPPPMPQQTPPPAPYSPVAPQPYSPQTSSPTQPQANTQYGHPEPMPKTYLVWAVAATVLCCLIPGVVAIIYSTMVSTKYYARDYEGARKASDYAQYWIIASIVLGVITATVYLPISILVNG
ncbi:MAG: CD225/dispanin family protein, partial [Muribaculaceae bacterium]|nr:CD225/dispanin family protein [Muribaculaceae bacterium]